MLYTSSPSAVRLGAVVASVGAGALHAMGMRADETRTRGGPPGGRLRLPLGAGAPAAALATVLAAALVTVLVARQALRLQARSARRGIGKPLGEQMPPVDRVYKKKYGDPIALLLLGDSIAAGLGAESRKRTPGAQLAKRLARRTRRAVHLRTAAVVGAETSMLRAQLAGLPAAYRADVAVIVVGGNDVTHRVRPSVSARHLDEAIRSLHAEGTAVVVGTCPDLGALAAIPQPLRSLARAASRQLAAVQRETALRLGAYAVSLADVVGPFFIAQPDQMFAVDRFHPSGVGYRRTAKALLPSVLAALGVEDSVPFGHHAPRVRHDARDGYEAP